MAPKVFINEKVKCGRGFGKLKEEDIKKMRDKGYTGKKPVACRPTVKATEITPPTYNKIIRKLGKKKVKEIVNKKD